MTRKEIWRFWRRYDEHVPGGAWCQLGNQLTTYRDLFFEKWEKENAENARDDAWLPPKDWRFREQKRKRR